MQPTTPICRRAKTTVEWAGYLCVLSTIAIMATAWLMGWLLGITVGVIVDPFLTGWRSAMKDIREKTDHALYDPSDNP